MKEKTRIGIIGVGQIGTYHLQNYAAIPEAQVVAAADLFPDKLEAARKKFGVADVYADYREMLKRDDIEAIDVCVHNNKHAPLTIAALNAGKHVFCEKPMTRYLSEAFQVYDTVKKTGKTYVIGSQGCMDPKWHKAAEWIKAGKLGPLVWGQGSYCRNNKNNSEWTFPVDPVANEQNLDWSRWLGKAPKIPFNPEHYFCWHKYYAYNSGIIGNLLPHRFYPLMLATGEPAFPRRVVASGTRMVSTDREITDTTQLLAEFPSGLTLVAVGTTVNEQGLPEVLRGRKATLHFASSQNRVELKPESIFTDELEAEEFSDPQPTERIPALEKNFFDCIRSGKMPVANVELAIRGQTVLCLAEMSERLGLALFFDEKTRTIKTGDGRVIPALTYDTVVPHFG